MGSLSIGFVGAAIYDILPSIVREYRKKFPRVSVALHELSTPDRVHALHDNRIDIGFLRPPIPTQLLELEPIQNYLVLYVYRRLIHLQRKMKYI